MRYLNLYLIVCAVMAGKLSSAQRIAINNVNGNSNNAPSTAAPFLTIAPDARSGGMGEVGVASPPNSYDTYWNPSKLAFLQRSSVSIAYSPWLRHLLPNANLAYLSFIKPLKNSDVISASLRYFNGGQSDLYDNNANSLGIYHPIEFALDMSVSRKYGDNFSIALTGRYIRSNQGVIPTLDGMQTEVGSAFAADASFYLKASAHQFDKEGILALGLDISNIGTKMSYNAAGKYFLPAVLRIGIADQLMLDDLNRFVIAIDLNKLLVPTPPERDAEGNIIAGKDDNVSAIRGIFGSFTDAPGGLKEELAEVSCAAGVEYLYRELIALRAGYFYEAPSKGSRRYLTVGTGVKYESLNLDFSYIIARQEQTPLANTLRLSVAYAF